MLILYTDIPKLYYVVLSSDHRDVSIMDHTLRPVRGGELRPLTATDINIGTNTGTFLNVTFGIFQVTSVTGRFKVT